MFILMEVLSLVTKMWQQVCIFFLILSLSCGSQLVWFYSFQIIVSQNTTQEIFLWERLGHNKTAALPVCSVHWTLFKGKNDFWNSLNIFGVTLFKSDKYFFYKVWMLFLFSHMQILEIFCFRDLQQLLSWELTGSEH